MKILKLLTTLLLVSLISHSELVSAKRVVNLSQINTEDGLRQNGINTIYQDHEGYLWIGTTEGLNRYDGYRLTTLDSPKNILNSFATESVWQDSTGIMWLSSSDGSNFMLDKNSGTLKKIELTGPKEYKLEYPVFKKFIEDKNKNLWIATFNEIYFYNRREDTFTFIMSSEKLLSEPKKEHIIRDILLVESSLYIATSRALLLMNTVDKKFNSVEYLGSTKKNENNTNVKYLHLDKSNQLMIGTVEGLYRIGLDEHGNAYKDAVTVIAPKLNIWGGVEKINYYWLATDKGLFVLDEDNGLEFIFKYSDTAFNTSDDDIVKIIEDREGNLWMGSRSDGLFKWHPNNAIKKILRKNGKPSFKLTDDMINGIHKDSDGNVWIATNNGITKLNTSSWSTKNLLVNPNEKETISSSTVYSITSNQQMLWTNGFDGINAYDKSTFEHRKLIFMSIPFPKMK
jgi:ligand-binding sensor domain-containing protein